MRYDRIFWIGDMPKMSNDNFYTIVFGDTEVKIDEKNIGDIHLAGGVLVITDKAKDIILASPPGGWSRCYRTVADKSANFKRVFAEAIARSSTNNASASSGQSKGQMADLKTLAKEDHAQQSAATAVQPSGNTLNHYAAFELHRLISLIESGDANVTDFNFEFALDVVADDDENSTRTRVPGQARALHISWITNHDK